MSTSSNKVTLSRPDGITDGQWSARLALAQKVLTGHAPWCEDHQNADDEWGGWCHAALRSFCAIAEISNGTTDGRTVIGLYLDDGIDLDELSIDQAGAIAVLLEEAARLVRDGNLIKEVAK